MITLHNYLNILNKEELSQIINDLKTKEETRGYLTKEEQSILEHAQALKEVSVIKRKASETSHVQS